MLDVLSRSSSGLCHIMGVDMEAFTICEEGDGRSLVYRIRSAQITERLITRVHKRGAIVSALRYPSSRNVTSGLDFSSDMCKCQRILLRGIQYSLQDRLADKETIEPGIV